MPGLEQHEAVAAQPVLEARAPEHCTDDYDRRRTRGDVRVGRGCRNRYGSLTHRLEDVVERVEVVEPRPEPVDAPHGNGQLERIERTAGGRGAKWLVRIAVAPFAADPVRGTEERGELGLLDGLRGEAPRRSPGRESIAELHRERRRRPERDRLRMQMTTHCTGRARQ